MCNVFGFRSVFRVPPGARKECADECSAPGNDAGCGAFAYNPALSLCVLHTAAGAEDPETTMRLYILSSHTVILY